MVRHEDLVFYLLAMAVLCERHRPSGNIGGLKCFQKKNSIRSIVDEYHISDRNDGHDDDNGSTRSWPSRTQLGAAYSLAEKYPFLFERKFGIRAFDYWWGYTTNEIELIITDQPVIDYNFKKDKKRSLIASKKEEDELEALDKAWAEKRNGRTYVGKTFSLNDFVAGNLDKMT